MKCHDPYYIEEHSFGDRPIAVGCGNCAYCVERKANEWAFRLMQEDKVSNSSYFITLTYDTKSVPLTPKMYMTLARSDLQGFFKRLRYFHDKTKKMRWHRALHAQYRPIKYYAVGEYGSKRKRPHYHAIVFNAHPKHINQAWEYLGEQVGNDENGFIIRSHLQEGRKFDAGMVHIGTVTPSSCRYVQKYMMKDQGYRRAKPFPWPYDGVPQFCVQSKGLGHSYLTPQMIAWHRADFNRNYCVWPGGFKVSMPRYYRDRIWPEHAEREAMLDHIVTQVELDEFETRSEYERLGKLAEYYARKRHKKIGQRNRAISLFNLKSL